MVENIWANAKKIRAIFLSSCDSTSSVIFDKYFSKLILQNIAIYTSCLKRRKWHIFMHTVSIKLRSKLGAFIVELENNLYLQPEWSFKQHINTFSILSYEIILMSFLGITDFFGLFNIFLLEITFCLIKTNIVSANIIFIFIENMNEKKTKKKKSGKVKQNINKTSVIQLRGLKAKKTVNWFS